MIQVKQAEKRQKKAKLAITGFSGSGKTLSGLMIAQGLGSKIGVIDSENGSASLYSDRIPFLVVELSPPFTPESYQESMDALVAAGCDVIMVDSGSHEWRGAGGILDQKDKLDQRGSGGDFKNWGKVKPKHANFIDAIIHCPVHMIVTFRSKTEWIVEKNDKGKMEPRKVGTEPITESGTDFEFDIVFDMGNENLANVSKDRSSVFIGQTFKPSQETGKKLLAWLNSGSAPVVRAQESSAPVTEDQGSPPAGINPDGMVEWMKHIEDAAMRGGPALVSFWKENAPTLKRLATDEQWDTITGWKDAAKARLLGGAA